MSNDYVVPVRWLGNIHSMLRNYSSVVFLPIYDEYPVICFDEGLCLLIEDTSKDLSKNVSYKKFKRD